MQTGASFSMTNQPTKFPFVDPLLVEQLDALFPDRCIRPHMTIEEAWIEAGARKVIEKLKAEQRKQEDNVLKAP